MPGLQLFFLCFTFLGPPLLWLLSRRLKSPAFSTAVSWTFAITLVVSQITALTLKVHADTKFSFDEALPMHLCDWAGVVVVIALLARSRNAFEVAYCWGIAGTVQALVTPAIEVVYNPRVVVFFIYHSFIPAAVLWMILDRKMRPGPNAYWHVMAWSQVYFFTALIVNHYTDANYGFLSHRPAAKSLLDHYPESPHWLYALRINATGAFAFALLLLPWWLRSAAKEEKD